LKRFSVRRIGLFGSFAHERQQPDSDLDFVVEFEALTYDNFYEPICCGSRTPNRRSAIRGPTL
jgi:predicted nucleotidyltransferase